MLQNNSLIVSLTMSQWSARKLDKGITDEVNNNHNAASDAGRYNKLLVAKENLEPITKVVSKARTFHYDNTLPWGDNNERLLTTKSYFEYVNKMGELKSEFDQAVADFLRKYDQVISEAKIRLNGMFKESDYPTRHQIEDKFGFRTTFMTVPDGDIRVGLNNEEVDKLRVGIESEINNRLNEAVKSIWIRVKEQVTKMRDKLSDKEGVFRDSLFENLKDLIEVLPKLNVTGDENINQVCRDMEGLLVNPETVRTNVAVRGEKAAEAANILNKFNDFFN